MTKTMLGNAVRNILHRYGLQITRAHKSAFEVQHQLLTLRDPLILDIGAHVGEAAREYRTLFPVATIHCIEPFPDSFHQLQKNLECDPATFCHMTAMSDRTGTGLLNANLSSATNSLLATDERGSTYWGTGLLDTKSQVEVSTTTVDAFCADAGIAHVDILKMDVQGAEYSVLLGAADMLKSQRISLIYTELITCPTYDGQHKLHEYLSLLDSYGYELFHFFNPAQKNDQLIQMDIVFLSSSFKGETRS